MLEQTSSGRLTQRRTGLLVQTSSGRLTQPKVREFQREHLGLQQFVSSGSVHAPSKGFYMFPSVCPLQSLGSAEEESSCPMDGGSLSASVKTELLMPGGGGGGGVLLKQSS